MFIAEVLEEQDDDDDDDEPDLDHEKLTYFAAPPQKKLSKRTDSALDRRV